MLQIIDKEMCKLYLFTVTMKGMPFKNFKIVKLPKLNNGIEKSYWNMAYLFIEVLIISCHTDIKKALWKKPGQ